jgi:hypothetical protein
MLNIAPDHTPHVTRDQAVGVRGHIDRGNPARERAAPGRGTVKSPLKTSKREKVSGNRDESTVEQ